MPWGSPNAAAALQQGPLAYESFPFTLIGNGLQAFYRCDSLVTDGSTISQINDQSGNGRHATQASALLQPDYDVINFPRAAAGFGGGPYLDIGSGLAAAMPANNWSLWSVFNFADNANTQGLFALGVPTSSGYAIEQTSGNLVLTSYGVGSATDGTADMNPHILLVYRSSSVVHMELDGVAVSVTSSNVNVNAPAGTSALGMVVLGLLPLIGWGLEWGAVSRVLTTEERAALFAYSTLYYNFVP